MSKSIDRPLLIAILILLGIGLLMIASAGVFYGQVRFGDAYYFFKQQLLGLGVGLILLFVFQRVHYLAWRRFVVPLFFIALGLLVLVFIPGFGTTVYGAARWVEIGPLSFQPSEVMKLSIILYLASWLSSRGKARGAYFSHRPLYLFCLWSQSLTPPLSFSRRAGILGIAHKNGSIPSAAFSRLYQSRT